MLCTHAPCDSVIKITCRKLDRQGKLLLVISLVSLFLVRFVIIKKNFFFSIFTKGRKPQKKVINKIKGKGKAKRKEKREHKKRGGEKKN